MRWKWPRSTKSIWTPWPTADSSTRVILHVILHSSFFQVLLFVGFRDVYIFTSMSFNILLLLHQLNAQLRQSSVCPLRMTLALDLLRFFGHPPPPQFDLLSHTFHADISLLCPLNKLQKLFYFIYFKTICRWWRVASTFSGLSVGCDSSPFDQDALKKGDLRSQWDFLG